MEASYGTLLPVLVQAIKELKIEIIQLKNEINQLKIGLLVKSTCHVEFGTRPSRCSDLPCWI
jgi:hypothetical protein